MQGGSAFLPNLTYLMVANFFPTQSICSTKSGRYRLYRDGLDGDGVTSRQAEERPLGSQGVWAARIITVKSSNVGCSACAAAGWVEDAGFAPARGREVLAAGGRLGNGNHREDHHHHQQDFASKGPA